MPPCSLSSSHDGSVVDSGIYEDLLLVCAEKSPYSLVNSTHLSRSSLFLANLSLPSTPVLEAVHLVTTLSSPHLSPGRRDEVSVLYDHPLG